MGAGKYLKHPITLDKDALKERLDRLYDGYDFDKRIYADPIEFPHRFKRPEDIEVSAFISSLFAYGKVELFKRVLTKIHEIMGASPYGYIRDFDVKRDSHSFESIYYRFNRPKDIIAMLYVVHETIGRFGSIRGAIKGFYSGDMRECQAGFIDYIRTIDLSAIYGGANVGSGFAQFFPSPIDKSPCKRLNMFLRWMVRDRDPDFGLYSDIIPKSGLIIPLDTHIASISRCIGLTERGQNDYRTAVEITGALAEFDPDDPLRYDFVICHLGISGRCIPPYSPERCKGCVLTL